MTVNLGGISVFLADETGRFQQGFMRSATVVEQQSNRIQRSITGVSGSMDRLGRQTSSFQPDAFRAMSISILRSDNQLKALGQTLTAVSALAAGFGGAIATKLFIGNVDTYTSILNRIKATVEGRQQQVQAEKDIFDIAQRTRSTFEGTATIYARLRAASPELAGNAQNLNRVIETVQKSFQVGGATTQEAASSAIQLAQALGSGRLQGDELRSILENNIPLARALAKELAGGSVGKLRELGTEGALTAQSVIQAILKGSEEIDAAFARTTPRIQDGLVQINNAMIRYIGTQDQSLGASAAVASGLALLARNFDTLGDSVAVVVAALSTYAALRIGSKVVGGGVGAARSARDTAVTGVTEAKTVVDDAVKARQAAFERAAAPLEMTRASVAENAAYAKAVAAAEGATAGLATKTAALAKEQDRYAGLLEKREALEKRVAAAAGTASDRAQASLVRQRESLDRQLEASSARVDRRKEGVASANDLVGRTAATVTSARSARDVAVVREQIAASAAHSAASKVEADALARLAGAEKLATGSRIALASATGVLSSAWNGLLGFVGGGFNLALLAVSAGFGLYAVAQAKAAQATRENKEAIDSLADALKDLQKARDNATPSQLISATATVASAQRGIEEARRNADALILQATPVSGTDASSREGMQRINDTRQALRSLFDEILQGKKEPEDLARALAAVGNGVDLSGVQSQFIALARSIAGAAANADGLTAALRAAKQAEGDRRFNVGGMGLDDTVNAEKRITDAAEGTRREAERLGEQLEDQNKKRAVAAALEKRLSEASRSTKESRIQTETDSLLSTSRSLGSGIDPKEARKRAEAIIAAEDRVSESEKKQGKPKKTDEEKFADRLRLLRAEGEAAFFNDGDKAVIEELKKLKSQPGLAEAAVKDVKSGRGLQGDALQIRDALERKKAGQEFNSIIEKYGDGAQLADKFAERQRLLNIMVAEGKISAEQAGLAFADYISKFQNFQWIDKLSDSITSVTETLITEPQNWKQSIQSFFKDVTRLAIQETISSPIKNALRSMLSDFTAGSTGGFGGFFGSLFKGMLGGGGTNPLDFSRGATGLYGPGFDSGGYTGPGGKYDVRGLVHADEFVFSKEATQRIGAGNLDALHRGALRGFASGGYGGVMSSLSFGEAEMTGRSQRQADMVARLASDVSAAQMRRTGDVNVHNYGPTQPEVRQNQDGSVDVFIRSLEAAMGERLIRGKGTLSQAMNAVSTNRQRRG